MTAFKDVDHDEDEFKRGFVIQFLATWVANNYADACARGEQKRLNMPPVEDAEFLAGEAWEHYLYVFD